MPSPVAKARAHGEALPPNDLTGGVTEHLEPKSSCILSTQAQHSCQDGSQGGVIKEDTVLENTKTGVPPAADLNSAITALAPTLALGDPTGSPQCSFRGQDDQKVGTCRGKVGQYRPVATSAGKSGLVDRECPPLCRQSHQGGCATRQKFTPFIVKKETAENRPGSRTGRKNDAGLPAE